MSVRVKVCGITRADDMEHLLGLGVDAVGMMFAEGSPRRLSFDEARPLSQLAAGRIVRVGVFANAEAGTVQAAINQVGLDALQFHGAEEPTYCASFGLPYLKAVIVSGPVAEAALRRRFADACAILFDAGSGGGRTFAWRHWPADPVGKCILAGGLGPENVGRALAQLRPWGVDVSSGVEGPVKGVKDAAKIKQFVLEVQRAAGRQ